MKIALVSELLPSQRGGLLNHVLGLGEELAALGHAVLFVGRASDVRPAIAGVPFEGLLPKRERAWKEARLRVVLMDRRRLEGARVRRILRSLADATDIVNYHGHYVTSVAGLSPRVVLSSHDYAGVCPKKTLFRNGDVCSTTNPYDCGPCYFGASIGGLRLTLSAQQVSNWRREVTEAIVGRFLVFVSLAQRNSWERYLGCDLGPGARVIPNFIGSAVGALAASPKNDLRNELGLPPGRMVVLASHRADYKGVDPFLDAWKVYAKDALTVVLGGDSGRGDPEDGVFELGWLPREETLRYLAAADVLIVPSLWPEPCPTVVLESVANGTPVVAMGRGGLPEMAERLSGWLTLADSVHGLCREAERVVLRGPPPIPPPRDLFQAQSVKDLVTLFEEASKRDEGRR